MLDTVLKYAKQGISEVKKRLKYVGDALGLLSPDDIYESEYYHKRRTNPWRSDARKVAETLDKTFEPNSVIDFGCAIGAHLEHFHEDGILVQGIDGHPAAVEYAVIPPERIDLHDLREPYETDQVYDLVTCFEVLEHIPQRFDDVLVDSLCAAGDLLVVTAAPPGQGGTHHINEQSREYWISKFEMRGFKHDPEAAAQVSSSFQLEEADWMAENLFVFRRA